MNEDLFNLEEFLERVQDDKELLLELLDIFSEDYVGKRKALQEAVEKNDFEEIKSISHSLKGASGNISAKTLRAIFLQFEEMGKIKDVSSAQEKFDALDKEYEELLKRFKEIKEEFK